MLCVTMKKDIVGLTLLLVLVISCSCSPPQLSRRKRVIGGDQYGKGEYPFHVSLWYMGKNNPFTKNTKDLHHTCGGSLVGDQWVLTSAFCFDDRIVDGVSNLTLWKVYLGMYAQRQAKDEAQYREIEEVFQPPETKLTELRGDIALLKLKQPADLSDSVSIAAVNADPDCPQVDAEVTIIGWGQTHTDSYGPGSDLPHKATLRATSTKHCHDVYHQPDVLKAFGIDMRIDDASLCAGLLEGGVDGCYGDSGSPLLATVEGGEQQQQQDKKAVPVIVGTSSYGYGCAEPGFPGVFTRVSAFSDWITETIRDN